MSVAKDIFRMIKTLRSPNERKSERIIDKNAKLSYDGKHLTFDCFNPYAEKKKDNGLYYSHDKVSDDIYDYDPIVLELKSHSKLLNHEYTQKLVMIMSEIYSSTSLDSLELCRSKENIEITDKFDKDILRTVIEIDKRKRELKKQADIDEKIRLTNESKEELEKLWEELILEDEHNHKKTKPKKEIIKKAKKKNFKKEKATLNINKTIVVNEAEDEFKEDNNNNYIETTLLDWIGDKETNNLWQFYPTLLAYFLKDEILKVLEYLVQSKINELLGNDFHIHTSFTEKHGLVISLRLDSNVKRNELIHFSAHLNKARKANHHSNLHVTTRDIFMSPEGTLMKKGPNARYYSSIKINNLRKDLFENVTIIDTSFSGVSRKLADCLVSSIGESLISLNKIIEENHKALTQV